jgi:hypothetical protein
MVSVKTKVQATIPTAPPNQFTDWLQICQRNLGPAPRSIGWFDRFSYWSIHPPLWAKKDQLQLFFKNQHRLRCQGQVVWGNIVQANTGLFMPGHIGYPADIVYASQPPANFEPEILRSIAHQIYGLKDTQPTDPVAKKVADHLTDEYQRIFGLYVPSSLASGIPCEISTIFIVRNHLPNGYLSQVLVPLLLSPEQPKIAMILPSKYWPAAMVDWWVGEG